VPNLGKLFGINPPEEGAWFKVDTVREYSRAVPIEYARARTLVQAREEALKQAMPASMTLDSLISDLYGSGSYSPTAARSIFALTALPGYIVEEKILHADVERFEPDHYEYRVRMRARILPHIGQRDPALRLDLSVERQRLMEGEELVVSARATKAGYLYLFYFLYDQSVLLIFPLKSFSQRLGEANEEVVIPSEQDRQRGLSYVMMADPNTEVTYETLYGVFCTQPIEGAAEFFYNSGDKDYNKMGRDNFGKFQHLLAGVPMNSRVERAVQIEILRQERLSHFF